MTAHDSLQPRAGLFYRGEKREYRIEASDAEGIAHCSGGSGEAHFPADFRKATVGIDEPADAGGVDMRHGAQIENELRAALFQQLRNDGLQLQAILAEH